MRRATFETGLSERSSSYIFTLKFFKIYVFKNKFLNKFQKIFKINFSKDIAVEDLLLTHVKLSELAY